jgi:hypothetical protein
VPKPVDTVNGNALIQPDSHERQKELIPMTSGQEIKTTFFFIFSVSSVGLKKSVISFVFDYLCSRVENGNPARARDARRPREANAGRAACAR